LLFLCRSLASSDLLGPCRQRLAAYLSAASLVSSASAISIGADVLLATTGHGSAMDIAGTGLARPDALLRSIGLLAGVA
jgi:isocitrate/isopropylmalate dehydrogenase